MERSEDFGILNYLRLLDFTINSRNEALKKKDAELKRKYNQQILRIRHEMIEYGYIKGSNYLPPS